MPPLRKYGTKKSTTSAASSAIFGRSPPSVPRQPLAELSSQLSNLVLSDEESGYKSGEYLALRKKSITNTSLDDEESRDKNG